MMEVGRVSARLMETNIDPLLARGRVNCRVD